MTTKYTFEAEPEEDEMDAGRASPSSPPCYAGQLLPLSFGGKATRIQCRQPSGTSSSYTGDNNICHNGSLGAGDSYLVENVLPEELGKVAFERMRMEVKWNVMHHRGGEVPRLVAVEGQVDDDGCFPLYRHPADESPPLSPFSPTVSMIRDHVQKILQHPVNHVLIQLYRSGKDYISEHSDKTIDVVKGSNIVNVSLGAQRVMTLRLKTPRPKVDGEPETGGTSNEHLASGVEGPPSQAKMETKTPRPTQRIPLPHNSMFVMGLETNKKWLHGIHHDNRPSTYKSPVEQFQNGERISLTFRHIGTFLTPDESKIYGQGAKGKTKEAANEVVHGGSETEKLVRAFGEENYRNDFDWEKNYGGGFDVLHFEQRGGEDVHEGSRA